MPQLRSTLVAALLAGLLSTACATRARPPAPACAPAPSTRTAMTPTAATAASGADERAHTAAVAALASEDFVARQRAAERLVAAGEAALPALGQAGPQPVRALGGVATSTTAPVIETILADLDLDRVRTHLAGPWPVVRRAAADDLGRRDRLGVVPDLIARLEDEDVEVRIAAVAALRRLTNRYFGFAPRAPALARREAVGRWDRWWSIEVRRDGGRDALPSG